LPSSGKVKFQLTLRQKQLFPLLMLGAFFEGFDFSTINLALPFITKDFHIDTASAGFMLSTIALGTLVAFFVVRLGDRVGRKPVFWWSVVLYSALSLLTALAPTSTLFVLAQFAARIFLVTVWGIGFIIVAEEFPVNQRGRALGLFQAAAAIGAIFPSLTLPLMTRLGFGWRSLYVLGALPLSVVVFLGRNLCETEEFQKTRQTSITGPRFFAVWERPYRRNMIIVSGLWLLLYACYITGQNFFSYRVVNELGWSESRVSLTIALGYTIGLLGYYAAGRLMDSIGRKPTAIIFLLGGAVFTLLTFLTTTYTLVTLFMVLATFFVGVFTVIGAAFTNELFPPAVRANATAWGNNIIGRLGQVVAPAVVGSLAVPLGGIGRAASLMGLTPILAAALVGFLLPETGKDERQDYVGAG